MEKKLDLILKKLGELDSIKEELNTVNSRLDSVQGEFRQLNGRVTHIESTMATKEDVAAIETVMATKEDLAGMATKEDVADIPLIKMAVLETREIVDEISEDQKSIHGILGEHEVAIRTLRILKSYILLPKFTFKILPLRFLKTSLNNIMTPKSKNMI